MWSSWSSALTFFGTQFLQYSILQYKISEVLNFCLLDFRRTQLLQYFQKKEVGSFPPHLSKLNKVCHWKTFFVNIFPNLDLGWRTFPPGTGSFGTRPGPWQSSLNPSWSEAPSSSPSEPIHTQTCKLCSSSACTR